MSDVTVTTWSQLQEALFEGSWNDEIRRYRSPFVYRGLSDKSYPLETSLMRLGGEYWQLERHMLRNFRKYAQRITKELGSIWHLLTVAQHHGFPTRLLDWTYSPYVALHFATAGYDKFDIDGVIWIVNFHKAHELLPEPLLELLESAGAQAFTVELLSSLRSGRERSTSEEYLFQKFVQTLGQFEGLGVESEFLLFFEPPSIDDRIVNQFALFSVMPNPQRRIDDWLAANPDLFHRLIIPASLKWECRDKLDQCNITERVLFPGLDGLSAWLKRHYSPKT
jgi:hypothetical protein